MEKINTDIYVDQEKNIKYLDLCIDKKTLENLPYGPRNLLTFLASPYTDDDLINLGVIKVKDHNSAPHIDAPQEDQFIDLATLMNFDKFED